jgi:8-oxo-dGTP diphosphatase
MTDVVANVEVLVVRNNRFLTIVRSADEEFGAGWLCFPGGKLEPGTADPDALESTARRELMEEVGLDVGINSLVYVESHTFLIASGTVLDIVMMTETATGEPVARDPAEVAEVLWLTEREIMDDPRVQPWTRESLRRAIARRCRAR